MLPDAGSGSQVDPNLLLSMMGNGNGFGGGNWIWVIFLFFLYGIGGNGWFGNNRGNMTETIASTAERDLLMSAIHGNANSIGQLASTLNCDVNSIQTAVNQVQNAITQVGSQVGMTGQQVINSVQQGNMSIAQQMSQCCCNVREAITNGNYQNQIATINSFNALSNQVGTLRTGMDQGFSANAYETQAQTCAINNNISSSVQSIKDTATVNTNSILAKLDQMQSSALQDRINELQETKTRLQNQISQEQQNQAVAAMIAPLQKSSRTSQAQLLCNIPIWWLFQLLSITIAEPLHSGLDMTIAGYIGNRGGIPYVAATLTEAGSASTNAIYTLPNHVFRFLGQAGLIVVNIPTSTAATVTGVELQVNNQTLPLTNNADAALTTLAAGTHLLSFNKTTNRIILFV